MGQSQLEHGFSVYFHVYYTCGILNPNFDGTYAKKKTLYRKIFTVFSKYSSQNPVYKIEDT